MKKIISFFAFAAIMLSFAACGGEEPENAPFEIAITETTPVGITFTITPEDKEANYFWDIIPASQLEHSSVEQELHSSWILDDPQYRAVHSKKGVFVHRATTYKELQLVPNTEYVLYAYHYDEHVSSNVTSPIKKVPFKTTLPSNYVDLGLPSQTIWNTLNGNSFNPYSYCLEKLEKLQKDPVTSCALIPTREDWEELYRKCIWEWVENINAASDYPYNAWRVTGPNGNFILLPAHGEMDPNRTILKEHVNGFYWMRHTDSDSETAVQFGSEIESFRFYYESDDWYLSMSFIMKPETYYSEK